MDEGRIKQAFFILKVSDSLWLVFERDLGTGGEILILSCLLHVKNQPLVAHWENEKHRLTVRAKGSVIAITKDHCKTGLTAGW